MSKIKLTGHASGTGTLTLTGPNTNSDRTITLPDSTATLSTFEPDGAVVINESGADVDFRVEGSGEASALFVQGSDGAVGIGTSSPYNGASLAIYNTTQPDLFMGNSDDAKSFVISQNSTDTMIGNLVNTPIRFKTNNTEVLRLTADGRGDSQFTARMWCNLNGTGTIAIRDSHNVSSISDGGTGFFTVYIDVDMDNANHVHFVSAQEDDSGDFGGDIHYFGGLRRTPRATGGVDLSCQQGMTSPVDPLYLMVVVFGD